VVQVSAAVAGGIVELLLQSLNARRDRPPASGGLELGDQFGVVLVEPVAGDVRLGREPGDGELAAAAVGVFL
jgi:hypothetical protein